MNDQINTPVAPAPVSGGNDQIFAIGSLVAGVISLCGIVIPVVGIPLGIIGLVLGYFGRRSLTQKTLAIIGMALSGVGILLSCVPIALILLGPKIGETFSTISNSLP